MKYHHCSLVVSCSATLITWENEIFTYLKIFADQAAAKTQCYIGIGNFELESNRIKSECNKNSKSQSISPYKFIACTKFLKSYPRSQVVRSRLPCCVF